MTELEPVPTPQAYSSAFFHAYRYAITNAIEAIEQRHAAEPASPRRILVKTLQRGDVVLIQFHDTGAGLSPENIRRYGNERFTTKGDTGKNLGLGATLIMEIARSCGGAVAARQSELADYSTVIEITVPVES